MGTMGSIMLQPLRQGLPPIDPYAAVGSASCALPARYEAVRGARQFTRTTLGAWGLTALFDDVSLVVSELVTNALRHAVATAEGVPAPRCPREDGAAAPLAGTRREQPVALHLTRWNTRLMCEVSDPSPQEPEEHHGGEDCAAESGRGLFLVESFSDTWGWHPLSDRAGKVVWALFCLPRPS